MQFSELSLLVPLIVRMLLPKHSYVKHVIRKVVHWDTALNCAHWLAKYTELLQTNSQYKFLKRRHERLNRIRNRLLVSPIRIQQSSSRLD